MRSALYPLDFDLIRMFRFQTSRFKSRSNRALIEHEQLIYAIEQRDPQLAEMLMRKHIARAKTAIKQALSNTEPAYTDLGSV